MSYDVAVIGGGPAGAVAALVLARRGRRVLLVDAPPPGRKIGESLPAIAGHLLRTLGLGSILVDHRESFGNVSAWGSDALVATDFVNDPHGMGWHLDRVRFDDALRAAAVAAGAELRVTRLRAAHAGWRLELDDGEARASCVIDATGRRAMVSRAQGAKRTRDDAQLALYTWAYASGVDQRTLVEATREGWWYTAPLPNGERVVALHVAARRARELAPMPPHVRAALDGAHLSARVRVTEACGARLDAFVGRGWIATGDAALSFDPIAAQGIFNALYTGMKAGEAVLAALDGDPLPLTEYGRRLEEIRAAYVERRRHVYALEARFPDAAFWRPR